MKKETWGIIAGFGIGLAAICLVFTVLFVNPLDRDNQYVGKNTQTNTENVQNTEGQTDSNAEDSGAINDEDSEIQDAETPNSESQTTETEKTESTESEATETEGLPAEEPETTPATPAPTTPASQEYPYYLRINRSTNCVTVYIKDTDGNYTIPVKAMACSVGRNGATPTGVFHTKAKYVWRELFGNCYGQYATRITGNVLFHSVPYRSTHKNDLMTNYYNKLGNAASAGCVRLSCADAKWIYDNCALGVTVEIVDAGDTDPLERPTPLKIDTNSPYAGWDPTDPDINNPWRKVEPTITGVKDSTYERLETADYTSYVTANDGWGTDLEVTVSGAVDTNKPGTYTVTYSAKNFWGTEATATAKITIKDTKAPVISQSKDIIVNDSTDINAIDTIIRDALSVTDNGAQMDNSAIVLDMSELSNAMSQKAYGTVSCSATATDAYGNRSNAFTVTITYEKEDTAAPVITVITAGTAYVDLTGVTDELQRQTDILNAAMGALHKDVNYSVSDDVSTSDEIGCTYTGAYIGATTAGEHEVTLTITAMDKSGKSSTANITVIVTVAETVQDTVPDTVPNTEIVSDTEVVNNTGD